MQATGLKEVQESRYNEQKMWILDHTCAITEKR